MGGAVRLRNTGFAALIAKQEAVDLGHVLDLVVELKDDCEKHSWPPSAGPRPVLNWSKVSGRDVLWWVEGSQGKVERISDELVTARVAKRYETWSGGFEVTRGRELTIPDVTLEHIGVAVGIGYRSDKFDGKRKSYQHDFTSSVGVLVGGRSKKVYMLRGGQLRITADGIEG